MKYTVDFHSQCAHFSHLCSQQCQYHCHTIAAVVFQYIEIHIIHLHLQWFLQCEGLHLCFTATVIHYQSSLGPMLAVSMCCGHHHHHCSYHK